MRTLLSIAFASLALSAGPALAQSDYPSKPVRIMVGANAGGGTDIIARMLAEKFAESLKQPFVVENRPGASNTIAADLTAKAPADGYTLLVATNTGQAIAPHLLKLGFDPLKQIQPVGLIVVVPNVLVVGDKVAAKDVRSSWPPRRRSRECSSTRRRASAARSTSPARRSTRRRASRRSTCRTRDQPGARRHPRRQVEMMFDTTSSAMPHIKSGRFRPLAVTSPQRSAELPNVPTIAEAGYPAAEMTTWYGLFVTGGTPKPIVDKLAAELLRVLKLPDVQAKLKGLGGEPGALSLEQFAEMNKKEYDRFGALIKSANIKAE